MLTVRRNFMETVTRDKLVKDLKDVLNDVEQLMRQAASAGEEQAAELRPHALEFEQNGGKLAVVGNGWPAAAKAWA